VINLSQTDPGDASPNRREASAGVNLSCLPALPTYVATARHHHRTTGVVGE